MIISEADGETSARRKFRFGMGNQSKPPNLYITDLPAPLRKRTHFTVRTMKSDQPYLSHILYRAKLVIEANFWRAYMLP